MKTTEYILDNIDVTNPVVKAHKSGCCVALLDVPMSVKSTKSSFEWSFKVKGPGRYSLGIVPENGRQSLEEGGARSIPKTFNYFSGHGCVYSSSTKMLKNAFYFQIDDIIKFTISVANQTLEIQKVKFQSLSLEREMNC